MRDPQTICYTSTCVVADGEKNAQQDLSRRLITQWLSEVVKQYPQTTVGVGAILTETYNVKMLSLVTSYMAKGSRQQITVLPFDRRVKEYCFLLKLIMLFVTDTAITDLYIYC